MSAHAALGRQFNFKTIAAHGTYDEMSKSEDTIHHVLAGSKAPLDILDNHTIHVTPYGMQPGHAGEYDRGTSTIRIHPEVIDREQGLLHELGHLHSARMGNAHAAYDTPERRAAEEHYAETFAKRVRR